MADLDELRWTYNHFEPDALEAKTVRLTTEIFKTAIIIILALCVLKIA